MRTLGVLGGTFDPVHHGHLRLAIECREVLGLDEVRLLPARLPNLRDEPGATAADRLAMLEAAVEGTGLTVDARELGGSGITYTVETLSALRHEAPRTSICFILGQDAFNGLPRWHRWQELLGHAHLVVATRPGYAPPQDEALQDLLVRTEIHDADGLKTRPCGNILLQSIPLLPISATDLRARVRGGRSLAALTPPAVAEYIEHHRLYR
jgi:nicotinate-nucleotide adenylyltransferase